MEDEKPGEPQSLLEQLPKIVADGKREAEQILEQLEGLANDLDLLGELFGRTR